MATLPRIVFTKRGEYEPSERTITCRMNTGDIDWKRNLAFPPDEVIEHTLNATTQMIPTVEAESLKIMRDHLKSQLACLRCLRYRRRRETDYLDTFKASRPSVRGFLYFNLFCGQKSGYDHPILMKRKSESPEMLEAHFQHCGTPNALKMDNAKEIKSKPFTRILRKANVDARYTEPHHPSQNLAEPGRSDGGRDAFIANSEEEVRIDSSDSHSDTSESRLLISSTHQLHHPPSRYSHSFLY